jgi:hypothetical protein
MFRRAADEAIDRAHSAIAACEMSLMHAFTAEDKARFGDELAQAQRFLARAIETRRVWDATDHDEYENYPNVPETDQDNLV